MTRRDPGPPRRLQDGSRVAYLEWIGEVKPAKRLGKKVGRGLPPGLPRPTNASATPPATPTPPRPPPPPPYPPGEWSRGRRQLEQAACPHTRRASACVRARSTEGVDSPWASLFSRRETSGELLRRLAPRVARERRQLGEQPLPPLPQRQRSRLARDRDAQGHRKQSIHPTLGAGPASAGRQVHQQRGVQRSRGEVQRHVPAQLDGQLE